MTLIAQDTNRFSGVVKYEFEPHTSYCRDAVNAYEASALSYDIGTVLGKSFVASSATATAGGSNVGTGTMGTVTVHGAAQQGVYSVVLTSGGSATDSFEVRNPAGHVIGVGNVGTAYSDAYLTFTLSDGGTHFAIGDIFTIAVVGAYQYKRVEATATDGSQVACAIYIGDQTGHYGVTAIPATTATPILVLDRGPVKVGTALLVFGTSVNSAALLQTAYNQLANVGILVVNQL